jgi:hypothetical protein
METATQSSRQLIKLTAKLVVGQTGLKWERNVRTVDSFIMTNSVSNLFMVQGERDYTRGSETERSRPPSTRCVCNKSGNIPVAYPGIFSGGQQIQLWTKGRENGDLGAAAP